MGRRWGFHSGVGHMKECRISGDLFIQDSLIFGDVSFGALTVFGRIATTKKSGSAITIPSTYAFGEAWEMRYTSELSNTQFQGIFLEVRTSVANTSTIRGAEFAAASQGAIAVGTLEGANIRATVRSTTTGNITNMFVVTGEANFNSSAYTGTVTKIAAVRGKVSMEDGATYTNSSIFLAEAEGITGSDVIGSILRGNVNANITADAIIDMTGVNLTLVDTDKVNLIKFKDTGGDEVILRVSDGGTVSVAAA